ncbi:hypothetical protein HHL16_08510 [Pseudoflavitalea sp. G-6-1-2]|uniref:RteC domain-containing protein n=1 Tax=Pseudoflavitalea sp. G-6-1-2 TaxID=2728841 RepID=UPI00146EF923|nr:RteC domain-containing protein [Pseudoflavitalea sp. G-6-1-2]NML20913.1 hypothetical protein [Pseudoflavitalea sp. G-6-1-2]
MKEQYRQLFDKMLVEMEDCGKRMGSEKEQIECCFQTCERNWNDLQQLLDYRLFKDLHDEIWFFKTVKPAFTGMLEYFALVYKAALFHPDSGSNIAEVRNFWHKELHHAEKFLLENEQYYQYYKTGRTEMDEVYFARAGNNDPSNSPVYRSHYSGVSFRHHTSHDGLFAAIQARDKYLRYVLEKIETVEIQTVLKITG